MLRERTRCHEHAIAVMGADLPRVAASRSSNKAAAQRVARRIGQTKETQSAQCSMCFVHPARAGQAIKQGQSKNHRTGIWRGIAPVSR